MTVIAEIKKRALRVMTGFQSDLDYDEKWIREHPGEAFIHVTRATGTHLVPMPVILLSGDDEPVPHLFGRARPSEIRRQDGKVLESLRASALVWQYFDGDRIKLSSAEPCIGKYWQRLQQVEARRRRQRESVMA